MTPLGTAAVSHTGRRVVSVLAGFALAATFVRFGVARKQQRHEQGQDAENRVERDPASEVPRRVS